jgi:hypothetical protein
MVDMRIEVDIPEGVSNDFEVAHYTSETTDNMWQTYLNMKNETHDSHIVLLKEGCPMPIMQDSEAEYNEHQWLWDNATGDILIGGLGIGLVNEILINNDDITSITIVENSQDVIDLVWEHCAKDDRFTLILEDFETWEIPDDMEWNIIWADTWLIDNTLDNYDYKLLITNKYSQHTTNIGFWGD